MKIRYLLIILLLSLLLMECDQNQDPDQGINISGLWQIRISWTNSPCGQLPGTDITNETINVIQNGQNFSLTFTDKNVTVNGTIDNNGQFQFSWGGTEETNGLTLTVTWNVSGSASSTSMDGTSNYSASISETGYSCSYNGRFLASKQNP